MSFQVLLHPKAVKTLQKLDQQIRQELKKKLKGLKNHPRAGKRLRFSNFWSLRVGDYRAIYEIHRDKKQIIVLFVGHRKRVYDDFLKLF